MKRRTFLTTLGAATAAIAAPLAYVTTHKKEVALHSAEFLAKRKARDLFQRFFKTATTFDANPTQMFWFDQYQSGQIHNFIGARQTGMTTFMLVLALFEKKVEGTNVAIFPQHHHMNRICNERIALMEYRLGKSIHDGRIFWGWHWEKFDSQIRGHKAKGFFMADAGLYPMDSPGRLALLGAPKESRYYFGTAEMRTCKGSEYAANKYSAPYFPIQYIRPQKHI